MTAPHYINEDKSDIRGIKPGWYAVEDDGNLSSGPFSSLEACVARITQPTNGTMASSCSEGRTEVRIERRGADTVSGIYN